MTRTTVSCLVLRHSTGNVAVPIRVSWPRLLAWHRETSREHPTFHEVRVREHRTAPPPYHGYDAVAAKPCISLMKTHMVMVIMRYFDDTVLVDIRYLHDTAVGLIGHLFHCVHAAKLPP